MGANSSCASDAARAIASGSSSAPGSTARDLRKARTIIAAESSGRAVPSRASTQKIGVAGILGQQAGRCEENHPGGSVARQAKQSLQFAVKLLAPRLLRPPARQPNCILAKANHRGAASVVAGRADCCHICQPAYQSVPRGFLSMISVG